MAAPAPQSFEDRVNEVKEVGGWAVLLIGLATASGANGIAQLLVSTFAGGGPELGVEGAITIFNAFVVTAPLAFTIAIAGFLLWRTGFDDGTLTLVILVAATAIGLALGNVLYSLVFSTTIVVDVNGLVATVSHQAGPWYAKVIAGLLWFLFGYWELFGPASFFGGAVAGGFAAYATHRLTQSAA